MQIFYRHPARRIKVTAAPDWLAIGIRRGDDVKNGLVERRKCDGAARYGEYREHNTAPAASPCDAATAGRYWKIALIAIRRVK